MTDTQKLSHKNLWLFVNFTSLVAFVTLFSIAIISRNFIFLTGGFISLILLIISFNRLFMKTKVFAFVHRKADDMDERELALARNASQNAYTIFSISILSLITVVLFALSFNVNLSILIEHTSILWLIMVGLIYFAHTLPAAIVLVYEEFPDFN